MNILIITDRYPHHRDAVTSSFVKSQVDCLKSYFKKIYVIALIPIIPKFLSSFSFMNPRWRRDAFAEDYEYDNVEVYFAKYFSLPFNFSRKKKGERTFKASKKIINRNNINFDLIHAHFTYPSGFAGGKLKDIYNVPLVLTVHEERDFFLNEVASEDEKLIYAWRNANKIIRVNKIDLLEFYKFNINKSKTITIPNGYSPSVFKPLDMNMARKKLGLPISAKILLNIANLETYKGKIYLIHAMKTVLLENKNVFLYIVGQGSLKNELRDLISRCGLQRNIILAGGNKPREEIPIWFNACDIFVLPSLSEGNPTVMFEALGCGKPFVGTNVAGIPEIINRDELGILVDPKDITGLARSIIIALDTEWDTQYILDYSKQFTWENITAKIIGVYDELIEKR